MIDFLQSEIDYKTWYRSYMILLSVVFNKLNANHVDHMDLLGLRHSFLCMWSLMKKLPISKDYLVNVDAFIEVLIWLFTKQKFLESKFQRCIMNRVSKQTSKMELFPKIVNGFQLLTIFAKRFILDVWEGSEWASECDSKLDSPIRPQP